MNSLLHLADSALSYYRGKLTGFWGLVGILGALLIAFSWKDAVYPSLKFVGIVDLLDKWGVIAHGSPELTAFRLFIYAFVFSVTFMVIGTLIVCLFVYLTAASQTRAGKIFLYALFYLLFSPLFTLYGLIKLVEWVKEKKFKKNHPEEYKEKKRLEKNQGIINLLISGECDEGEDNLITHEEAFQRLNRLPSIHDRSYLIGIGYDRECYLLLPRPFGVNILGTLDEIQVEQINVEQYIPNLNRSDYGLPVIDEPNLIVVSKDKEFWKKDRFRSTLDTVLDDFEFIIDCSKLKDFHTFFSRFSQSMSNRHYVQLVQDHYFNGKRELMDKFSLSESKEQRVGIVEALKRYDVVNEEAILLVRGNNEY
ncbi:hypothetical protein MUN89_18030 [Halobacillus salinarum]|uniref:Uncharacterized protein n=1 Tax=Halobacillus salinarum TaxID=2932257 RepID=A0ABY4EID8_9BACI|nr:hypothetical protein [Halobacillus salinarum]UOQ43760.1 hypothetical protein MUN89_18030 [Halobacillus salinarum]